MKEKCFYMYGDYFTESEKGYFYRYKQFCDLSHKISRISKQEYLEVQSIRFGE